MKQAQSHLRGTIMALAILASVALVAMAAPGAVVAEGVWGPDRAETPAGDWDQLGVGEDRWYAFEYAGDGSPIQARLQTMPEDSAGFVVWTPDQIYHWGLGWHVEPVGRSSPDPRAEGVLTWSGSFPTSGTYYVAVEHAGNTPATSHYQLEVSGGGVSLSKPEPAPIPEPAESQTQTKRKPSASKRLEGKLVFQTTLGGDFYTINVDGGNLQRITHGLDPVWSPDGTQIAFTRLQDPRGVWVIDASGSGERRLFDWREARYPSWSPDGEEIVFSRQHRGRLEEIERCRARGGKLFCFTLPPNPHYNLGIVREGDGSFWEPLPSSSERSFTPDWSPAGDQIVYADVYGLFIQSADGQTRYELTANNKDTTPAWSPDGKRVTFVRRQHDHWEIYVVDADGRNLTRLTNTPALASGTAAHSVSPAWSPDGDYLAFLTNRTGQWQIWVMEADGNNQRSLFGTELDGLKIEYTFQDERTISWTQ